MRYSFVSVDATVFSKICSSWLNRFLHHLDGASRVLVQLMGRLEHELLVEVLGFHVLRRHGAREQHGSFEYLFGCFARGMSGC